MVEQTNEPSDRSPEMMDASPERVQEYRRALNRAGWIIVPSVVISLQGADALDLLQRISTNDLNGLQIGETRQTLFITEKAKLVAPAFVHRLESEILVTADTLPGFDFAAWLDRFVIMEDIRITDRTADYTCGMVVGPSAKETIESADGVRHLVVQQDLGWLIPAYRVLVPAGMALLADEIAISASAFEMVRITLGVPGIGTELTDRVNPFEAGVMHLVNFTKGCYIGQEVVARLDTYKKVQKQLSGFIAEDQRPLNPGEPLRTSRGEEAGVLTSVCYAPAIGRSVGLGLLRTNISDERLQFGQEGSERFVRVVPAARMASTAAGLNV